MPCRYFVFEHFFFEVFGEVQSNFQWKWKNGFMIFGENIERAKEKKLSVLLKLLLKLLDVLSMLSIRKTELTLVTLKDLHFSGYEKLMILIHNFVRFPDGNCQTNWTVNKIIKKIRWHVIVMQIFHGNVLNGFATLKGDRLTEGKLRSKIIFPTGFLFKIIFENLNICFYSTTYFRLTSPCS